MSFLGFERYRGDTKTHVTKKPWVLFYGLIIGPLLCVAFGSILIKSQGNPGWVKTTGKVVRNVPTGAGANGNLAAPVIEYKVDYASFEITSKASSSPPARIGAKRTVSYDKNNPRNAKILPTVTEYIIIMGGILGSAFIGLLCFGRIIQLYILRR
jgi:hypothetical protein